MPDRKTAASSILMPIAFCLFGAHATASAENIFFVYGGTSFTRNSDLHVARPGVGTAITLQDVKWDADPFKAAP